jgi:hypothetical protein
MSEPRSAPATTDTAAALTTALWRSAPPALVRGGAPERASAALRQVLARVADDAARLAEHGPAAERPAAGLLAETARVVADALRDGADDDPPARAPAGGLASGTLLRLARMERWLAERESVDPQAGPSADLCLWVLEHLEVDAA